ncbi:MAG: hypothetical protein D3M94_16010 [Rhodocyclales bacterium GT-UBC]|nr:MAG: hypothetical protein D3M94_16010 [Rhodocyclales bacterium GT-UBC]
MRLLPILCMTCLLLLCQAAQAEYCEENRIGEAVGMTLPACSEFGHSSIRWSGGSSTLSLHAERGLFLPVDHRIAELNRMVAVLAERIGAKMSELGGLRLPASVHLIVVDAMRDGDPGVMARTIRSETPRLPLPGIPGLSDPGCPVLLYQSARFASERLTRTLAHELFHCMQYATWPGKTSNDAFLWWAEGSAEWFEDFAFPELRPHSDLEGWVRSFRTDSIHRSLLQMQYQNVVFFSWLTRARIVDFLAQMAGVGESPAAGASRALSEDGYMSFARDYVDGRIVTPSGLAVQGDEFGAQVPTLGRTTGVQGRDPPIERRDIDRFLLFRGKVIFTGGDYQPSAAFGSHSDIFSEGMRGWTNLPTSLRIECDREREFRVAGMSQRPDMFWLLPNTLATSTPPCRCPAGPWTIQANDIRRYYPPPNFGARPSGRNSDWETHLDVPRSVMPRLVFRQDGVAEFSEELWFTSRPVVKEVPANCSSIECVNACIARRRDMQFCAPRRQVNTWVAFKQEKLARWRWRASGDQLIREPLSVSGATSLFVNNGFGERLSKRTPHSERIVPAAVRQTFVCSGNTLHLQAIAMPGGEQLANIMAGLAAGNRQQQVVVESAGRSRGRATDPEIEQQIQERIGEMSGRPAYPFSGDFIRP